MFCSLGMSVLQVDKGSFCYWLYLKRNSRFATKRIQAIETGQALTFIKY